MYEGCSDSFARFKGYRYFLIFECEDNIMINELQLCTYLTVYSFVQYLLGHRFPHDSGSGNIFRTPCVYVYYVHIFVYLTYLLVKNCNKMSFNYIMILVK